MTFPFGIKNLDELYKNSESGNGGFFPLGKGVLWHSGIHINSETAEEFSPLLNGKVVMYRLSEDYKTVDLPEVISKNKFGENESYYGDFYKRSDNNEDEYTLKETQSKEYVSDCFVMLKHELHTDALEPSTFIFYTLYMNLEPVLKSGLYKDTNFQIDGKIHVLSDEDCFSASTIGKPGLDKGHRYFDYVLILEKDVYSYSSDKSKPKDLFLGIKPGTTLYGGQLSTPLQSIQSEELFIPVHTRFEVNERSKGEKGFAKLISLKTFRICLLKEGGLQGEKFEPGKSYEVNDCNQIWFGNGQSIDFSKGKSSLKKEQQYLYDILKDVVQSLKGTPVTVVDVTEDGRLSIDIAPKKGKEFWAINDNGYFAQDDGIVKQDKTVTAYSKNPYLYNFTSIPVSDELRKSITCVESDMYKSSNNANYYKAMNDYSYFFIDEETKNECLKSCFDWDEWFFKYKPSDENSIRSENTSLTKQLIDWYEIKRKKYGWLSIALSPWWGLVPYLTWKSLKLLYDGKKDVQAVEQMPIEYRKCVCQHPIEWDVSIIEKLYDAKQDKKTDRKTIRTEHIDYLKSVAKVTDIWKDGLSKIFTTKSLFFANPLYFISHLEKCGVFEFNPYAGKKYSEIFANNVDGNDIYTSGKKKLNKKYSTLFVKTNPGFAPVFDESWGKNNKPNVNGYGCITGFFNSDYIDAHKNDRKPKSEYYHEGIDFRGSKGTDVVSLIYGTIVCFGKSSSMGGIVLMRANTDTNIYYLAVHLDEDSFSSLTKNKQVSPGEKIAKIGGYDARGAHLHVSVIKLQDGVPPIGKDSNKYNSATFKENEVWKFPTWDQKNEYRSKMKNPFDYSSSDYWAGFTLKEQDIL